LTAFRFLLAVLLLALVGACTTAASPSAEATETAEATAEPTEEEASPVVGETPGFDLPSSAPELEEVLPDQVGDLTMQKFSMRGAEFMTSGDEQGNEEFVAFLDRLGAQPDDVSVAFAFGFSEDGSSSASVFAFRVAGVPEDQLTEELQASLEEEGSASGFTSANVAGKDVLVGETGEEMAPTAYLYGVGDIVFFVATPDQATAEEVLENLP
jgi:hypothetical protein